MSKDNREKRLLSALRLNFKEIYDIIIAEDEKHLNCVEKNIFNTSATDFEKSLLYFSMHDALKLREILMSLSGEKLALCRNLLKYMKDIYEDDFSNGVNFFDERFYEIKIRSDFADIVRINYSEISDDRANRQLARLCELYEIFVNDEDMVAFLSERELAICEYLM